MSRRTLKLSHLLMAALAAIFLCLPAGAAPIHPNQLSAPPLGERWFGIVLNGDLVGFTHQNITAQPDSTHRIETNHRIEMQVMGFKRKISAKSTYSIGPRLAMKSFEIEQNIKGNLSRLSGKMVQGGIWVKRSSNGKTTERILKAAGEVIPDPLLNLVPFFMGVRPDNQYQVLSFDPEDLLIKEITITVTGIEKTPAGIPALRMHNNLYPFVTNDIWVDHQGNTLLESVREGLLVTRAEQPDRLTGVVSGMALSQKDLIYDFSQIRILPPLKHQPPKLTGLSVIIKGYGDQIPLLADGWQQVQRQPERVIITTGSLRKEPEPETRHREEIERYLLPAEGIESTAQTIKTRAKELTDGIQNDRQKVQTLAGWTAAWLEDSTEDSGSALAGLTNQRGNCQTHAKLYTALARAAGIPTRFVSGLVSQNGTGFLYHSWAESWLDGRWMAVDPTFNQVPADPTHLAFFEGNRLADLEPLVGIIGKISIFVLEER
jgi:hypothetical protein